MKTIYSLALLCLMGCSSKPKPSVGALAPLVAALTRGCPHGLFLEYAPNRNTYDCVGFFDHVTPEQWQAAQGLYMWDIEASGKGFEVVDWNYLVTTVFKCRYQGRPVDCHGFMHADQGKIIVDEGEVSMMDTFPPRGDAK